MPLKGAVAVGATNMYRFSSCGGTESFTVSLQSDFGNADLLVWNTMSLQDNKALRASSSLNQGLDVVTVAANLGYREHTIGVRNVASFATDFTLTLTYAAVPVTVGIESWTYISQGCSQYFAMTLRHRSFDELLVRSTPKLQIGDDIPPPSPPHDPTPTAAPTSTPVGTPPPPSQYRQHDIWVGVGRMTVPARAGGVAANNTALNTVTVRASDARLALGTVYLSVQLGTSGYAHRKACVSSFGLGSSVGTPCTSDAGCSNGAVCRSRMWCHTGSVYGQGRLQGSACSSSLDCNGLSANRFKCEKATGKCTFAADATTFHPIAFWDTYGLDCQLDSQCSSTAVLSSLVCAGPSTSLAALETTYVQPGATRSVTPAPGEARHLLQPNCAPGSAVDVYLGSGSSGPLGTQGVGEGKLYISHEYIPSPELLKKPWCAGGNCHCRVPSGAQGSGRLIGAQCELHANCTSIATSSVRCSTGTPRSCQFKACTPVEPVRRTPT